MGNQTAMFALIASLIKGLSFTKLADSYLLGPAHSGGHRFEYHSCAGTYGANEKGWSCSPFQGRDNSFTNSAAFITSGFGKYEQHSFAHATSSAAQPASA